MPASMRRLSGADSIPPAVLTNVPDCWERILITSNTYQHAQRDRERTAFSLNRSEVKLGVVVQNRSWWSEAIPRRSLLLAPLPPPSPSRRETGRVAGEDGGELATHATSHPQAHLHGSPRSGQNAVTFLS